MASTNGIELPVSLLLKNLNEIANLIKQFANKNVLADSFGGKKLDSELNKILTRLELISAKSKTAFTTLSDFTSVQKEINLVELSLNKVLDAIKNLGFSDLKIPAEFSGQIAALLGRIRELNGSLATFKGTLKEKLVNNVDFMANLLAADPKLAAKWLEKSYDELLAAINDGMSRVNMTLSLKAAEFADKLKLITQNSKGKTSMTQWGALSFIEDAFKTLPNDDKLRNTAQLWISEFMKTAEDGKEFSGFAKGAQGMNKFLASLKQQFSFSDEQMAEMRARIKLQVLELRAAGEKEATAATVVKSMGKNEGLAKLILFGTNANDIELAAKKYANDIKDAQRIVEEKTALEGRAEAFGKVKLAFDAPNEEIKLKADEIAEALKVPEAALKGFEESIVSAATKSPELAALFQKATGEIATLTNTVELGKQKLLSIDNAINKMQGISNFINRYVGLYAIVRKVTTAIRNAFNNIKELDKAITGIAVVTNMSQLDLWGKIGEYTLMAQQYGVATKDVYEVSQIFYQQGLQTSLVMSMTTESLKMAKIAGIDYTTAANAMTVAVRAFKLEMTEAQSVTDTYSALAAKFAVSSSEIANAMEKTASSAASVGMSLQSTSAFISVMEQTTRESAQNIGSALKSIISRYGEMKASPEKLLNVEGEEVAFNKVDTALASIGISIKDASGQFRDFDDVIMELASKWNVLDNNTQRYIATIMAGNRQQSRFIALVSNYDELSRAMNVASNAENASIVLVAKTMDSLESKANLVKNAFSQLYLDLHIEEGLKNAYDWLTRVLKTIGKLGTAFGTLPTLANIIGFGTGAKALVGSSMDWLKGQKGKWEVKTEEAQLQIEQVRAKASEDIITKWLILADLSLLEVAQTLILNKASMASTNFSNTMLSANPNLVTKGINDQEIIATATKLYQEGQLKTADDRAYFMKGYDINPDSELGRSIDALLLSFTTLLGLADSLSTTLEQVKNAGDLAQTGLELTGTSGLKTSDDLNNLSNSTNNANIAENNEISASAEVASAKLTEALENLHNARIAMNLADAKVREMTATDETTRDKLLSALAVAHSDYDKALAALKVVEGAELEKGARSRNTGELDRNTGALRGNTTKRGTEDLDIKLGISWKNNDWGNKNAMKIAGVASSLARMAGTAIVAAGALYQDKSTDKVETSKLLTGVGNGLSMAGTGASMGMALGPWGAALGAIGGFLVGGLGAIIDGANMTLAEQIALLKEEAKKAADDNLKALAKATDLSSQIDNLKQLQKVMYNSTNDMQAYKDAMNTMADLYPQLISSYDEAGNAIIDINNAELALAEARLQGAKTAREAAILEGNLHTLLLSALEEALEIVKKTAGADSYKTGGIDSGVISIKNGFKILLDNGQFREFEGSKEELAYNESSAAKYTYDYIAAFKAAAPEVLGHTIEEATELTYDEISLLVEALKENPALGGKNYKYFDNPWKEISKEHWKLYEEQYLAEESSGMTYTNLTALDNIISEYSELFGGKTTARLLISIDNEKLPVTLAELNEITEQINGVISENLATLTNIRNSSNYALGQESLFNEALKDSTLASADTARILNKGIYSKLFDLYFLNYIESETDYDDALAWYSDDYATEDFNNAISEQANNFLTWYKSLKSKELDVLEKLDFTLYTSVDTITNKLGITEDELEIYDAFELQFIESNQVNRDRILNLIWTDNGYNRAALGEIEKIDENNLVLNIADLFTADEETGAADIISKYADYFSTQLLDINKLAENGYTLLASTRLQVLNDFANSLDGMTDELQNAMFGIITNTDFSSYDSIQTAIKNLLNYASKNGIKDIKVDEKLALLYNALEYAANNLLFNVNTLAQELTSIISSAAKDMDSLVATNKSGLSLDKALEEFANLLAQFSDITKFDLIFTYDAALLKYVYTTDGLQKAINARQLKLAETSLLLSDTARLYTEKITNWDEETKQFKAVYDFKDADFSSVKSLLATIASSETDPLLLAAYLKLAKEYMDSLEEGEEANANGLQSYIEELAKLAKDASSAALLVLSEFEKNKKNQYYQAIDWSKLALGTDFSGTNLMLADLLAEEVGLLERVRDAEGNIISETWKTESKEQATPEELQDAYLKLLYAGLENAELLIAMAKTRLAKDTNNSKVNMASTAISELLSGGIEALSEESIALLTSYGQHIFKVDEQNNITSELDTSLNNIQLALDTYWKTTFNSIDEANNQYIQIIEASFAKANAGKSLLSNGNKLDFNTIGTALKSVGLLLDDVYKQNEETGQYEWREGFENALTTDIFGQTTITNWDNFVAALKGKGIEIGNNTSAEYLKWYRAYIDAKISEAEAIDPKKIVTTLISNLGNAKVGDTLNITNIKDILGLTVDEIYISTLEQLDGYIQLFELQLLNTEWVTNNSLAAELVRSIVSKFKTKDNRFEGLKGVIAELVSRGAAEAYASAMGYTGDVTTYMLEQLGYYWDDYSKLFKAGSNSIEKIQSKINKLVHDIDAEGNKIDHSEEIAILTGMLKDLKDLTGNKATNALRDILTNYTNVTNTMVETFEALFTNIDLDQFITEVNGKKELDIAALRQAYPEIAKLIDTSMQEEIAAIVDDNLAEIENATNLIASGTTSLKDMAAFVTKYNNDMETKLTQGDLFSYNDILDSFTLKPEYLLAYIEALKKELIKLGMSAPDVEKFANSNTIKLFASAVDIDAFREAENTGKGSIARGTITGLLNNFLNSIAKKDLVEFNNSNVWNDLRDEYGRDEWLHKTTDERVKLVLLRTEEINLSAIEFNEKWADYLGKSAEDLILILENGGEEAVKLTETLARAGGREATTEELTNAYYTLVDKLKSAAEQVEELTIGSIISTHGKLYEIMSEIPGMVDENGVIQSTENMTQVYYKIYELMKSTSKKTLSDLNKVYAQYLTASELGDIDAVAAMGDAMGMTYETLGEILGKSGVSLEAWLANNTDIYLSIGAGKIRITDFNKFAAQRGWKPGTEEYTQAFKAYNDSLIDLDRKTEKSIVDEIKGIADAKVGDKINLTDLASKLENGLNSVIQLTGATLENGILTITDGTSIPTIILELTALAAENAQLLPEELAELADTVNELLSNMVSLISNGISGGLKADEARTLTNWAKQYQLDLNFDRTKEGLKLSRDSAEQLYQTLKNVDSISALIVLDELNESIDLSVTSAKELEGTFKEIAELRATTESDDFKFMSHEIPSGQNNPINYLLNWSDAFAKIKATTKGGAGKNKMDYSDFYNIITEMGNLANLTGAILVSAGKVLHDSEEAAALIELAALCLSVAADGSVKVDLSKLGINFASGADTLKSNVNDGIKAIAQSLIEMLDGMIQLMETIVAMEELGNIDTDNKGTIDLGEIFDITNIDDAENHLDQIKAFTEEFDEARKRIYEKLSSSEDGKLALEKLQVRIGLDMVSAAQLLDPKNTFDKLFGDLEGEAKISAIKGYQGIFDALYKAYLSGNYNLNDIIPSIKEILAGTGYTGDIRLGDTTLHFTDGLSYEIDSKGHYIYNGKDYGTDENAIKAAIKTDQLKIYSNIVGAYDEANLQFTNTAIDKEGNTIEIVSRYNIDTNKFEATFSDGTVVTSDTTAGLSLAIQHYVAMADLTLNEVNDNGALAEANTLLYSITKKGEATVNWEVSLETGEVKYVNVEAGSPENAYNAGALAQWQINRTLTINYTANTSAYETGVKTAKEEAEKPVEGTVNYKTGEIEKLTDELKTETGTINWTNNFTYPEITNLERNIIWHNLIGKPSKSQGDVGVAQAKGTLMGELGPELVVQGGRYFVAGQNGAEMVNLEPDAIVFNHLQTKSLLEKGMSNGRGHAVTNERNAVAFATGNINGGPAMASASAALAALIELRNQWKSLLGLNAKDLSNLGGSGGGGGGGKNDPKAFIKDLEKWYNWLQRIAVLEQKITYEELKRSKIQSDMFAHGQDYAKSELESLDYLKEQAAINQSLVNSQQAYFDKRREQMNSANNPFSALYTFDEYGQLKYKNGALEKLSLLSGRNNLTGEANYTAKELYEILTQMGYGKYMDYDSSGNPIDKTLDDWYVSAVEAFWNKIDADQQEMQSLHDSIEEHKKAVLEALEQANEIMHDIEDNQISVEDKVLKAVEDIYQLEIDNALDTRDAIEKANNALLDGLDKLLAAEKLMYDNLKDQEDLTRLQRQLAILQRSGGSASLIASLQSQISDKQLDIYFDQLQELIDALREASENELLRLDAQIDLMTETLEYAKANGLLWEEVYDVMAKSPEEITSFITEHDRSYWGESPTAMTKDTREILFEAGRFKAFSEMVQGGLESLIKLFTDEAVAKAAEEEENKLKDQASSTTNTESPKPASTPAPVSSGGNTTAPSISAPSGPTSTSYKSYNQNLHYKITYSGNTLISKVAEAHSFNGKGVCSKCGYQKSAIGTGGHTSTTGESAAARISFHHLVAYDRGGMVEKDGAAYVHAKEGVLTPEQTSILRNEILSNKPTSLLSLLTDFRDAYNSIPGASAYSTINSNGIIIENATVEMNVSKIANDYDAQRAGEQALDKILSIARKTQGQNRIGR